MSIVIDNTYFLGLGLAIPNAVSNTSITGNVPTTANSIDSYIEKYEPQFLKNAIGYTNYNDFKEAIEDDATLSMPGQEFWKELRDGKMYTYEGKTVEWQGLAKTFGTIKNSLIANYVFYHYLLDNTQHYSTTGMVVNDPKNAEKQTPNLKLTQVWREFIQMYQYGHDTSPVISANASGMIGTDYHTPQGNAVRSLYQFLRDNDNYGDYNFVIYENRNQLGL